MFSDNCSKLAAELISIGAVKFGSFRLKLHERHPEAPLSPIYIDLRVIRSFPAVMDAAVAVYLELVRGLNFDLLADVPTAATPFTALISHQLRVPMISPRKEVKAYGTRSPIDGVFHEGQTALLIDDLITKADSKLEAVRVLKENGLLATDIAVLIDREQGGVEELRKQGIACHSAFKLSELLGFYRETGRISREDYERTTAYLKNQG